MMKIELENVLPREIEKRSFELITEELGERTFPEEHCDRYADGKIRDQ